MTTSSDIWEYDAPQYVDFTHLNEDDENPEEYFSHNHEDSGMPLSFSEGQSETSVIHNYNLRSSSSNTPQKNGTAKRNLPNRSALKEMNNLTPAHSRQAKSGNTPQKTRNDVCCTVEKENNCEPVLIKSELKEPGLDSTTEEKKQKNMAQRETPVKSKSPAGDQEKVSVLADPASKRVNDCPPVKRLKRSASSAVSRPRRSVTEKKSPQKITKSSQATTAKRRSLSAGAASSRSKETKSVAKKAENSADSKNHCHTASQSVERSRSTGVHKRAATSGVRTRSASQDQNSNDKKHAPKMTATVTPAVLKHKSAKPLDPKTSEQLEIEEINKLRKELAEKRKLNMEFLKMAQTTSGYMPVRAVQPATVPKEFHFLTDERLKASDAERRCEIAEIEFISSLRRNDQENKKANEHSTALKPTIPQPFKLHENKHTVAEQHKFQSAAELMLAFSTKTPERFRTKPKNKDPTPTRKRQHGSTEQALTIAKTPKLETRNRSRPVTVISQAELEEKEIEEIKKYKFHAKPVNEYILKNPNCGVHKVQPKESTKPEEFELKTDRRIQERRANKSDSEEEHFEFHANPVPKKILEGTVGVKPAKPLPLTVAESPAFALKQRLRSYKQQVEKQLQQETKQQPITARPVPHPGIPFQPVLSRKTTEVHPFSFEERTKMMLARKEEKIKKILEEERKMRDFHANPLPSSVPDPLPDKHPKSPTVPKPFHLKVDERRSQHAEEWARKLEEELRQQRAAAMFKARPPVSVLKAPFIPKPSTKPPTDIQEFELSTEQRKEKWAEQERYRKEKEAELAQLQMALEKRKQEEEEEEIRRLRNAAVHQANPVRRYKPVEIKPSDKPLTVTESPRFSERLRSRVRHASSTN